MEEPEIIAFSRTWRQIDYAAQLSRQKKPEAVGFGLKSTPKEEVEETIADCGPQQSMYLVYRD
jgi:hypothetical protein